MRGIIAFVSAFTVAAAALTWVSGAQAQSKTTAQPKIKAPSGEQALVEKARATVEKLLEDKDQTNLRFWMKRARAVLIVPNMLQAAFLFGARGGSGVLLTRDGNGVWSYPAFYSIGGGSFGPQIGIQGSEVVFVFTSDQGLKAVLDVPINLSATAAVAVGPAGAGISGGTTTNLSTDILSFSRTQGLYGGMSFDGSVTIPRNDWNRAYYGRDAASQDIVLNRLVANRGADALRNALNVK